MSDVAVIVLLLMVAAVTVAVLFAVVRRPSLRTDRHTRTNSTTPAHELAHAPSGEVVGQNDGLAQVLSLSTERANEIYLFGPAAELERYGTTLATAPPQLARHTAKMRAAADGVRSYGELSGRLVLVDDKTAAALKTGKMMKDRGGEILAHVLNDDKKISSVTRLREVGGLASNAAAITNAISAMAMQAQLDRIERKLSEVADGIDKANRELLRAWHSKTRGAQEVLGEVYRTANAAGQLTSANWQQIQSIGHVLRTQINGDRDRLEEAVAELEQLAAAPDVKQRRDEFESKVAAVRSAHAALSESTRAWAQYSALRLWHLAVTDDPTLEAYGGELRAFISASHDEIEPMRRRVSTALEVARRFRWTSAVRHPLIARKLPTAMDDHVSSFESIRWHPLELPTSSQTAELPSPTEGDE